MQVRFRNRRAQREFLDLSASLVDSSSGIDVDVIYWPAVVCERGIGCAEVHGVHPARGGRVRIVRLNHCAKVAGLARQTVQRIAVMHQRVLQFDVRGRVSKQDARVRFRRWNVQITKVRLALCVEVHPKLQSFDRQVFQIDVAPQVQRVQILNAHRCQQSIDLAKLLAGLRVIEFDAEHLYGLRR